MDPKDMDETPTDWESHTIADLMTLIMDFRGRTPKKLGMEWGRGNIPALSARNVKAGYVDLEEETYYGSNALYRRWMSRGDPRSGDIVMTTEAPLGNVAMLRDDRRYILSQRTVLMRVDPARATSRFVYYALQAERFQRLLVENSSGSTATGIQRRRLEALDLTLPSDLEEQDRIASTLADFDALEASLDRLVAKKRMVREAALQLLLSGEKRLAGFTDPWTTVPLGTLAAPRKERIDPRRTGSRDFCVELEHIEQKSGRLLGHRTAGDQSSLKSVFYEGDVLFGKLRPYLRKYWLADRPGVCSTEIWVLEANRENVRPAFLSQLVKSDMFMTAVGSTSGTRMPRADWGVVKGLMVPLPRRPEQDQIAAVLRDMDDDIELLEERASKTRLLKEGVAAELLSGKTRLPELRPLTAAAEPER